MITIAELPDDVRDALARDLTIDIVTRGARTGQWRTTEIWYSRIGERITICGTQGRRDWLANLKAHADFWFCLKESIQYAIPARASVVIDPVDRRDIMSAPATRWYREQGASVDQLIEGAPIVEVFFRPLGGRG